MHPLSSAQLPSEYKVHHHPPPNPTIYTAKENSKVTQKSKPKYTFSDFTSKIEGNDLSEMRKVWQDTAASEMRMDLMATLKSKKVGFREIENFSLGLSYNFKSSKLQSSRTRPTENVVKAAMQVKMVDEKYHHRELKKVQNIKRKKLGELYHPKTHTYKKIIQYLRQEAGQVKRAQKEKYEKKIEHLENIYKEPDEEVLGPPEHMAEYSHLSIFNITKFEGIQKDEVHVPVIGDVHLSKEEELILKRTPKFAIPQVLKEDSLKEEMEKAYSLVRMELRDEEPPIEHHEIKYLGDKPTGKTCIKNPPKFFNETKSPGKGEKEEEEKEQAGREAEARARQVFDPITQDYDERKRRATDLAECARVTLPRPLSTTREAEIELRRELHDRVFQEYRREFCTSQGEQENNISEEEKRGLESLVKRMKKENLIIMRTDKSGKLCVTSEEKYLEMGKEHVEADKVINREKIRETDKVMNEHSAAWCSIWRTGTNHEHQDRVVQSKTSKSENRAKLYLAYKDHKKERHKTRPIGTACSSNTRAFANSVSELLESVANCETKKFEVISTEDLLHNATEHNHLVEDKKREAEVKKEMRKMCLKEQIWKMRCKKTLRKCTPGSY